MTPLYDLHTHTTCSDGTYTPKELLHLVKKRGFSGLSITDHDTTGAYTKELFSLAQKLSLRLITGVEITSRHKSMNVHILAYGFSLKDAGFQEFLSQVRSIRQERNAKIFTYLKEYGILLTEKDFPDSLSHTAVLGRLHIARLLVQRGYVASVQEAFDRYLKDTDRPWSQCQKIPAEIVIQEIHKASAKAVLAHPFFLREGKARKELLSMSFDGIEARYASMPSSEESKWIAVAEKRGFAITGGSDFHGDPTGKKQIGSSWMTEEMLQRLLGDACTKLS